MQQTQLGSRVPADVLAPPACDVLPSPHAALVYQRSQNHQSFFGGGGVGGAGAGDDGWRFVGAG